MCLSRLWFNAETFSYAGESQVYLCNDCRYTTRNEDHRGCNNKNKHSNLLISSQIAMSIFFLSLDTKSRLCHLDTPVPDELAPENPAFSYA